jgi:hypothetical protein
MRCLKIPNTKHFHDITVIEVRVNPLINHQNTASVLVLSSRYPFINSHDFPPSPPSSLSSSSLILSPYSLPSYSLSSPPPLPSSAPPLPSPLPLLYPLLKDAIALYGRIKGQQGVGNWDASTEEVRTIYNLLY